MATFAEPKSVQFVMRLSETEKDMLRELSEATGKTGAEVVRGLIRREHAAMAKKKPQRR